GYVALARASTRAGPAALCITHGFSGSGKTRYTQALLEMTGAVRIRTDVERKRLHGVAPDTRGGETLYARGATELTYRYASELAGSTLDAGYTAIIDGAFLRRWQRDLFRTLAAGQRVPFVLIDFVASNATLRERVARRSAAGTDASDADLAVLDLQLRTQEPLGEDERADVIRFDAETPLSSASSAGCWRDVPARPGAPPVRG